MKPITYIVGDATRPQGVCPVVIAHCCNDVGAWGAGFVLALSKRWPKAEKIYREWAQQVAPRQLPLGRVGIVEVDAGIYVANIIGQRDVGPTRGVPPMGFSEVKP